MTMWNLLLEFKVGLTSEKSSNIIIYHINRLKDKISWSSRRMHKKPLTEYKTFQDKINQQTKNNLHYT